MPTEIEAKMRVVDFDAVRAKLREVGAEPNGIKHETNLFFDTPTQSLRRAGKGLRIRVARDADGKDHCTITMKGPLHPGPLKAREEIEFTVSDPAAAQSLFEHLGYQARLRFEKTRESWVFQTCKIELDELPDLGKFVEIEGDSDAVIMSVREQLSLADHALITEGYASMIARIRNS